MTAATPGGVERLEAAVGYRFEKPTLLIEALTHPSAPQRSAAARRGYERLEFLGDRVLDLIVAQLLWQRFPDDDEGALTRRQVALVRRETLAAVAREITVLRCWPKMDSVNGLLRNVTRVVFASTSATSACV